MAARGCVTSPDSPPLLLLILLLLSAKAQMRKTWKTYSLGFIFFFAFVSKMFFSACMHVSCMHVLSYVSWCEQCSGEKMKQY